MEANGENTRGSLARMSDLVAEWEKILFEEAPVMVYTIDESCSLLKVNRRWLATMGYRAGDVLGHKCNEFLTEESGIQIQADVMPLLWEVGRAHSIGCSLLRRNGRVLDVSLDAVVTQEPLGRRHVLAALHDKDDLVQWQQAALTINALKGLFLAQNGIDRILSEYEVSDPSAPIELLHNPEEAQSEETPFLTGELVIVTQEIVSSLRSLVDLEGEHVNEIQDNRQVLKLMAENMETTLSEMTSQVGST